MPIKQQIARLLTSTVDIYKNSATGDVYGHTAKADGVKLATVASSPLIPLLRKNRDNKGELKTTVSYYSLYIMPWTLGTDTVDENHWLHIGGLRYDIVEVLPPMLPDLPLELLLQRAKP